MIILISGPERSFKDGLGAIIASDTSNFEYPINRGFGNCHLYKTPYPWTCMPTYKLLKLMNDYVEHGGKNSLFYISEADRFLPARGYKNQKQTDSLTGSWQGERRQTVLIANYHPGDPEEPITGVDLILRAAASIKIKIEQRWRPGTSVRYLLRNVMYNLPEVEKQLINPEKYFGLWDSEEQII